MQLDLFKEKRLFPSDGDTIAVWFSCGVASAVALAKTIELYGNRCTVRAMNNPIKEEHPDNRRFLRDVENWLGIEIEEVRSTRFTSQSCVEVWDKSKAMSFPQGAPCTSKLKKEARFDWEKRNKFDWIVMGFSLDEIDRADNFRKFERANLLPILEECRLTKAECFKYVQAAGIKPPITYYQGLPSANCLGCVKATSATYWNLIRETYPEVFEDRAEQSRRLGCKLARYKGDRVYLDELPPDAVGAPLKSMKIDCGIFCEE